MNCLVIVDDTRGYGSSLVRALSTEGHYVNMLNFSKHGVWPFLRDSFFPRFKIKMFRDKNFRSFEEKVIEQIKKKKYDVILFCFGAVVVSEYLLKWCQKNQPELKQILYLRDTIAIVHQIKPLLSYFWKIYTFSIDDIPEIKKSSQGPVELMHLFCNDCYQHKSKVKKEIDICFVGSWAGPNYLGRRAMLKVAGELSREFGWNFVVIGVGGGRTPIQLIRDLFISKGFTRFVRSGPLNHEQINNLYQKSKVVINSPLDNQKTAFPMRTFEVPGSGTCLVMEYMCGISELYEADEVITYNSLEELREVLIELLNNDSRREKIALKGMRKTLSNHLISNRVKVLMS